MPSSAEMVAAVVRDTRAPAGSGYREPGVLLGMLDAELRSLVLPHVLDASGDYLLRFLDVPVVPGRRAYRLPARAVRFKSLHLLREGCEPRTLVETDSEDAHQYARQNTHWHMEDNAVVPLLHESQGGTLRFRYYRLPSSLVLPAACFQLTQKTSDGTGAHWKFTCPSGTPPALPASFDIVRGTQPYETAWDDGALSQYTPSLVGSVLTLNFAPGAPLPAWDVGDWLCAAGTAPYAQVPLVFHDVVVTMVAARVCREIGDLAAASLAEASAAMKKQEAMATITPRTRVTRPIVNRTWF